MKKHVTTIFIFLWSITALCNAETTNTPYNLDFETWNDKLPINWTESDNPNYSVKKDATVVKTGSFSVSIENTGNSPDYKSLMLKIPDNYAGTSITL